MQAWAAGIASGHKNSWERAHSWDISFANALSHSREAVSGTRYFPGKTVIKAIGLSNYEKNNSKKGRICLMESSVKKILAIFADMKCCDHSYWYPTKEAKGTHLCDHLSL